VFGLGDLWVGGWVVCKIIGGCSTVLAIRGFLEAVWGIRYGFVENVQKIGRFGVHWRSFYGKEKFLGWKRIGPG